MRQRVEAGEWMPDMLLPSRRELAQLYNVDLKTIQRAISPLISDSLLRVDPNRGTFIARRVSAQEAPLGKIGIVSSLWPGHVNSSVRYVLPILLSATERAISSAGGTNVFVNRQDGTETMSFCDAIDILIAQNVNAVVILGGIEAGALNQVVNYCRGHSVPLLILADNTVEMTVPHIMPDNVKGGEQAAAHLIERGCGSLLFLSGASAPWVYGRLRGVQNAMAMAGLSPESLGVYVGHVNPYTTQHDAQLWINICAREAIRALSQTTAFDGVVCSNDYGAIGFIGAARERGLEPGRDYLIIGFDDSDEARRLCVSSMQPPIHEMGHLIPGVLRQIMQDSASVASFSLPYHLVARMSSLRFDQSA